MRKLNQIDNDTYKNDIHDENKRQQKIKKAKNSFQEVKIESKFVVKCEAKENTFESKFYHNQNTFKINGEEFCGCIDYAKEDILNRIKDDFYASVCIINLFGYRYSLILSVYHTEQKAFKKINLIPNKIEFKFLSNNYIKYKVYRTTNVMGKSTEKLKNVDYCYKSNISLEVLRKNKISRNKLEYKSVEVKVKLYDNKLKLVCKELDCLWIFKRQSTGRFNHIAKRIIKDMALKKENKYILNVKNNGDIKSERISKCGNWWIVKNNS